MNVLKLSSSMQTIPRSLNRTLSALKIRILLYKEKGGNSYLVATGSLCHKPQTTLNHRNLLNI